MDFFPIIKFVIFSCIWNKDFHINYRCWKTMLLSYVRQVICDCPCSTYLQNCFLIFSVLNVYSKYSVIIVNHVVIQYPKKLKGVFNHAHNTLQVSKLSTVGNPVVMCAMTRFQTQSNYFNILELHILLFLFQCL